MPAKPASLNSRKVIPIAVAALLLLVWLLRGRIHFDWATLGHELRFVSLPAVAIAVGLTYICYWLRAMRWAVLLSPVRKSSTAELLPAQFIGFTLVALLGRVTDLARPWLIARRVNTPVATQLAIYSIERAFDLGAAAVLFSIALAFAPHNMPHHEAFARTGLVSLAATLFLAIFAAALRFFGDAVARLATHLLKPLSEKLAHTAAARILDFRDGLRAISTVREFLVALALSLIMWAGIALGYWESAHAFRDSPPLATLSLSATMLLLATGMGGSLLQLPILGWFTQMAILAAALHGFFDVPVETATACGAVLLFVSTLCVIPAGLITARIQGIALTDAARSAEQAEVEIVQSL